MFPERGSGDRSRLRVTAGSEGGKHTCFCEDSRGVSHVMILFFMRRQDAISLV